MMNVVQFNGRVVLVFEGDFESLIRKMELHFGPNTYYDIAGGKGILKFGEKTFTWSGHEKNMLSWSNEWAR